MKIALIIASALLIVGMIIGTIGLASNSFNFNFSIFICLGKEEFIIAVVKFY